MVEYKSYLKLNLPKHPSNAMGLSWECYDVVSCEYDFQQTINSVGEPNSGVTGGIIHLVISTLPTNELMAWVFDHAKKQSGEVTIVDTDGETREQVNFENARCIDFNLQYKATTKPYTCTKLTLMVDKIQIGDAHFENLKR